MPSKFSWNQNPATESSVARAERCARRNAQREDIIQSARFQNSTSQDPSLSTSEDAFSYISQDQNVAQIIDIQVNEDVININESDRHKGQSISVTTQTSTGLALFSSHLMLTDDESVYFYTGLETAEKFRMVLSTLMPMAQNLKYRWGNILNLSIEDQFLLLLIKLRRVKPDFELGKMFGISKTQVSNVFITWVNFVYDMWSLLDLWPRRDLVNYYMPEQFQENKMPTRLIIDCTEIPITKPSNPSSQQITFSSYKNTNTIKFLVGSTPGGLLCYCSEGFGGSTSDRQIIERSTLMNICDDGDSIMADRGFNVQDLFAPKNIAINIPTFLRGRTQLPGLALLSDRKVASQRVHIERLIGLAKTFKILKSELNAYYVPLASKIFFICFMLCNFRECIMK